MSEWYAYMVRCADNSLYAGIARNVEKRLHEHNTDNRLGAKYTRGRRPVVLVFQQDFNSRSEACKFETMLKSLTKTEKEKLLKDTSCATQ